MKAKNTEKLLKFYVESIEHLDTSSSISDEEFIKLLFRFVEWLKTPQGKEGLNLPYLDLGLTTISDVINNHILWLRMFERCE